MILEEEDDEEIVKKDGDLVECRPADNVGGRSREKDGGEEEHSRTRG